jgi:UPF0755 protein
LVEGWTFRQMRAALAREELRHDTASLSDAEIMQQLGRPACPPRALLSRYLRLCQGFQRSGRAPRIARHGSPPEAAWAQRSADTPLKSADEALILASIVEKETGQAADRPQIAGVFANRLRTGMLLQTDPTVIYGLGEKFDGNLRKRDLQTDTPWNTYTRAGLPPTPIAMPGKASLMAAVQPRRRGPCTSWRAATAAAISAPRSTNTTAPSALPAAKK